MRRGAAGGSDIDQTAAALRAGRRVLVTGCAGLSARTAARACDLAEALGAAIDPGAADTAQTSGPTIARIGEVTADPEELRDRADLVLFWFCDPAPAFLRGFVTPSTADGRPRHTVAVGPRAVPSSTATNRHLPVPAGAAIDLARLLHASIARRPAPAAAPALAGTRDILAAAIDEAGCVAIVTHHRDPIGLEPWSLVGLVRALARRMPAFEVPLTAAGTPPAVCTWRYGAPGAIARADRDGAEFRPAECDAVRLIARGEVDCVVAVGPLPERVEAALAARGGAVNVVRVAGDDEAARSRLDALVAALGARAVAGGDA